MVEEEGVHRSESGLQASCSLCLRLCDLVWLQGHWNWRYAVLGSILASNGRNAWCVFYNFLVRRREILDSELAPGSRFMPSLWSPYLIFIAMICELWGGNKVPFMKRSRELLHQPWSFVIYVEILWKKILYSLIGTLFFCHRLSSFSATGWFTWVMGMFLFCSCLPKELGFHQ